MSRVRKQTELYRLPRSRGSQPARVYLGALLCFVGGCMLVRLTGTASHWAAWMGPPALAIFAITLARIRAGGLEGPADTYGSAAFAERSDVECSGLLATSGIVLGGWRDGRKIRFLRHDGPEHCLLFAPSRSGKGTSMVVPTLLSWTDSCVVFDPKGENWNLTSGWRKQELGSLCLRFNPTATDGRSACFNPLSEIQPGPLEVRGAQQIADILTSGESQLQDPHWRTTAADLLTGAILHCLYTARDKSLPGVLHLLSDPSRTIESTLSEMIETKHDPAAERAWADPITGAPVQTHPVIAAAARTMLNRSERERGSVLSTAIRSLTLWRDFVVSENTRTSDFSLADLVHLDRPVSLYLTIPVSDLARTRPLVRLLFALVIRRLTEEMDGQRTEHTRRRLLLMLDEFPQLHHIPEFEDALPVIAGFGIKCFLVVQDLTQIFRYYGRNQAITNNCDVLATFRTANIDTARLISGMAGTRTVRRESRTISRSRTAPWHSHLTTSEQESPRPLVTPDEVMRLPEEDTLIFAGGKPIRGVKTPYFEDLEFSRRAAIPPVATSDRIPRPQAPWPLIERDGDPDGQQCQTPKETPSDDRLPSQTASTESKPKIRSNPLWGLKRRIEP